MLKKKRKKLIKEIVFKIIIATFFLICILVRFCSYKQNYKRAVYKYISEEYPNLEYNEQLSDYADKYAEIALKSNSADYDIESDSDFKKFFPSESYATSSCFELKDRTSESVASGLLSYMNEDKVLKGEYIGIGIYYYQVTAIVLYDF